MPKTYHEKAPWASIERSGTFILEPVYDSLGLIGIPATHLFAFRVAILCHVCTDNIFPTILGKILIQFNNRKRTYSTVINCWQPVDKAFSRSKLFYVCNCLLLFRKNLFFHPNIMQSPFPQMKPFISSIPLQPSISMFQPSASSSQRAAELGWPRIWSNRFPPRIPPSGQKRNHGSRCRQK